MPLRVLHVTPYGAGAWAYGGIPRIVMSLGAALARQGHEVTVATTDVSSSAERLPGPHGSARVFHDWTERSADGVTTHVFPNVSNALAYGAQFYTPLGLNRFLAEHAGDFDVAHLHACRNVPGVIAARHLTRAGVPYVLAPNGTAPRLERRLFAKRIFDVVAGRRVLEGAARLLAVSEAEVHQLIALGVRPGAIRRLPNPVDVAEADLAPAGAFRTRLGLGAAPVVLFLGKLTPRKRVGDLVDAVAHLARTDVRLVIAGNDMGTGSSLRARVASLRLEDRTTFTGLLVGPERLAALGDADVVVYPSEHEIFGLVPLEAMLMGTPVVVAGDSGCAEIVEATGGGLIVPVGDVGALARAISAVLADPVAWRTRVAEAALLVRERYAPDRVALGLTALYEDLIGRTGRKPRPAPARIRTPRATESTGVSVVIPVRNGAPWIRDVVASVRAQAMDRPIEIIAVEDGSEDASCQILGQLAEAGALTVLVGPRRGAAAAINMGVRAARFPLIAQVDQDVVLEPGWLARLTAALDDPAVAAAQGRYLTAPDARFFNRVMGLDLAQRYAAIRGRHTDHVCTGNTLYRASALHQVGLLDESLGYGYDNDLSYRLQQAGYTLAFCRAATSVHGWRDSLSGYCRQQYGFGYGRIEVVERHPSRLSGDRVSPAGMMLHPVALATSVTLGASAGVIAGFGGAWSQPAWAAAAVLAGLVVERTVAGVRATYRFRDRAALAFPAVHLLRDAVWVVAAVTRITRRLGSQRSRPSHSMQPRRAAVPYAAPNRPRA